MNVLVRTENISFDFGQFLVRVEGNPGLMSLIPDSWQKWRNSLINEASVCAKLCLVMDEKLWDCTDKVYDGWTFLEQEKELKVAYIVSGKIAFMLSWSEDRGLNHIHGMKVTVSVRKQLDSYVRLGIQYGLLMALYKNCIGLHGCTVLCDDEIVILSAPSGTGKTTLSLLLEKYNDAIVINGDFALLSVIGEDVIFEPTPFCGTSCRCLNHRFRVNRIVFLAQAKNNRWEKMTGRNALIHMLNNSFLPGWDREMQQTIQENILKLLCCVKTNYFAFAPDKEAVFYFRENVKKDTFLDT